MKEVFWGRFVFCRGERKRETRLDKRKRESGEGGKSVGVVLGFFLVVLEEFWFVLGFFLIVLEEFWLCWDFSCDCIGGFVFLVLEMMVKKRIRLVFAEA